MKKLLVLLLGLAAAALPAQTPPRVFGLNLFALPVEVALGDDWQTQALAPRSASPFGSVAAGAPLAVKFRRVGVTEWSLAKGSAPVLEAGAVYLLVVRSNGAGELARVPAPEGSAPKVLFVNGARTPTAVARLGTASADGLEPGWSAFVDAAPGKQTLTWSWPTMPPGTDFYRADSPQPGRPGSIDLASGHWYVAVVSSLNGQVTDLGN